MTLSRTSYLSRVGIVSAFLFFTFLLGVKSVSAATITVDALTNTGGAGCELREAILSANTDTANGGCTSGASGSDTINFSGSGTIDISNQNLPNINSIVIMDGGDDIVIDAFNTSSRRIFTLSGTTSTTFTLSNITLQNGSSTNGGCISMEDAPDRSLTLDDVDFIWCTASGNGGAVYVPNGTANLLMTDSTFTSSSAVLAGGALWAGSGTYVTSTGMTAFKNRAGTDGGAFYVTSSAMTVGSGALYIANSTFTSNTSTSLSGGGALFSGKLMNTIATSTFVNNHATSTSSYGGGAILFLREFQTVQSNIVSSVFRANYSSRSGGAIDFERSFGQDNGNGNIVMITNSTFDSNSGRLDVLAFSLSTSTPSIISGSLFLNNSSTDAFGSAFSLTSGSAVFRNNTFERNRSAFGPLTMGPVRGTQVDFFNNTFFNNESTSNFSGGAGVGVGGAIYAFAQAQDQITIRYANNLFENNHDFYGPNSCVNDGGSPATFISLGTNFFSEAPHVGCDTDPTDIIGGTAQLGTLQDNGGYNFTRLPADNSIVVNAASVTYAPAVDQRGFARPQGAGYDIGSVDISDATAPILAIVTPVSTPQGDLTPDFSFSTDQAGTISYPGTCSSVTVQATSGTNAITFNTLTSGTRYDNCQVRVTDSSGNATTLTLTTFETTGSPGSSGGSSGGGGGLGSAGTVAIPPVTTQFQTNLQNLQNQGVSVHGLIKIPSNSAVYYIGSDGKRHAFPNDKVYFTWYENFDGVQLVNEAQLASIPLGKNVTYKPGKKMVKFTTDNKVYVVAKGGILRWVTTEAAATALYGSSWNMQIDDISDAFYTNYTFGNNVSGLSDFNPTTVQASVQFPSDSLEM